ncbi:MAG: hypothetical protein A2138_04290 [Deltaproteobacteria bacterium RBG_16_71_12]|nr:MAG: hypothetical protein A2138_04290 [Deltaproteobacteria bacterium RBG_16_71_12]
MKRGKASVVWELLEVEGAQRLVVDVDAPLRPFGADPTPPHGIKLSCDLDEPTEPDGELRPDDLSGREVARPSRPTAEVLSKALRTRTQRAGS